MLLLRLLGFIRARNCPDDLRAHLGPNGASYAEKWPSSGAPLAFWNSVASCFLLDRRFGLTPAYLIASRTRAMGGVPPLSIALPH